MEYAPSNELGVVFLFAHVARKLQFRIEAIRPQFPDCIAYRRIGDSEREVRIEFEFKSSNFRAHGHDPTQCDIIVCWHHNWPEAPIEVIELKRRFGVARKVWIQQALKSQWEVLDSGKKSLDWSLSKNVTHGDVLVMYRCAPISAITDVFTFTGNGIQKGTASWREGNCYSGTITRMCHLASPLFLEDMRRHKVLKTSSFIRRNMQGKSLLATEYWPYLHEMIMERNPAIGKILNRLNPDKL